MKKFLSILTMCSLILAGCGAADTASSSETANPSSEAVVSSEVPASSEVANEPTSENAEPLKIAALKGPTAMGMAKMMADNEGEYEFILASAPDELTGSIIQGELDVSAVPANLAATLWNKTEGKVQLVAINTLGVLYIVENGNTISSVADLKGKTIYATGKGSTPEFSLNYVLEQNGLVVGTDVMVEYKTEHAELATLLAADKAAIALLPEPFVTTAMSQNENIRVALDLGDEWVKVSPDSNIVTGGLVIQSTLPTEKAEQYAKFMEDYAASVEFMTNPANISEAAKLIEEAGIISASVAEKALPKCSIAFITGDEMMTITDSYYNVLFTGNPASVGGALPTEEFYAK